MKYIASIVFFFFSASVLNADDGIPIRIAEKYIGLHEDKHTDYLQNLMEVDPIETPWCAAFVNAILKEAGFEGTNSLLARSFLKYGEPVDDPVYGDLVIFPRRLDWQGHVGFFLVSYIEDGIEYYIILGGNQDDSVNYKLFRADEAIGIRRY